MHVHPEVMRFAIQRADGVRLGKGLIHHSSAGTAAAKDKNGLVRRNLRYVPPRTTHRACHSRRVEFQGFFNLKPKLTQNFLSSFISAKTQANFLEK